MQVYPPDSKNRPPVRDVEAGIEADHLALEAGRVERLLHASQAQPVVGVGVGVVSSGSASIRIFVLST